MFYCHEINATTALLVQLMADDGTKTQALAVCHADNSGMDQEMLREALKLTLELTLFAISLAITHFYGFPD